MIYLTSDPCFRLSMPHIPTSSLQTAAGWRVEGGATCGHHHVNTRYLVTGPGVFCSSSSAVSTPGLREDRDFTILLNNNNTITITRCSVAGECVTCSTPLSHVMCHTAQLRHTTWRRGPAHCSPSPHCSRRPAHRGPGEL